MKFGKIDNLIILGGSYISIKFLKLLKKNKYKYEFFTSNRLLNDTMPNNKSLKENLLKEKIVYSSTENINKSSKFFSSLKKNSLIIGFGEPWKLNKKLLIKINKRFLDFMGIPMPQYRGGAHYSWMILNKSYTGGCFLQNVNHSTIQGYKDTGYFYMKFAYNYPKKLKIPKDFFNYSIKKEILFLKRFLNQLKKNKNFTLKKMNNYNSILFPRLNTQTNGYINWNYDADEINRFINAFSDPYKGASTFYKNKKVFFKNSTLTKKNNFHSFASGLIVNIYRNKIHIAVKKGIISVDKIFDSNGKNIQKNLDIGERFKTNIKYIEKAKVHEVF